MNEKQDQPLSPETIVTHSGREPFENRGYVNTPVYRGSTILFPTLEALESPNNRYDSKSSSQSWKVRQTPSSARRAFRPFRLH
jgi:cystathionine beta-lyase/cystathionine gamma-synthase